MSLNNVSSKSSPDMWSTSQSVSQCSFVASCHMSASSSSSLGISELEWASIVSDRSEKWVTKSLSGWDDCSSMLITSQQGSGHSSRWSEIGVAGSESSISISQWVSFSGESKGFWSKHPSSLLESTTSSSNPFCSRTWRCHRIVHWERPCLPQHGQAGSLDVIIQSSVSAWVPACSSSTWQLLTSNSWTPMLCFPLHLSPLPSEQICSYGKWSMLSRVFDHLLTTHRFSFLRVICSHLLQ